VLRNAGLQGVLPSALAIHQTSEIPLSPGVNLVGPLPEAIAADPLRAKGMLPAR
jgi:hypothetical protein